MRLIANSLVLSFLAGNLCFMAAAQKHIGVALANGDIRIDQSAVRGNATLFEGSVVETLAVPSKLLLTSGAEFRLLPQTQARVFKDRLVVERGEAELRSAPSGELSADGFLVRASEAGLIRLSRHSEGQLQVAALSGEAQLLAADGRRIATVPAGLALAFDPQSAGAAPPITIHGRIYAEQGKYYVQDCRTGQSAPVTGEDLQQWNGRVVEVSGSMANSASGPILRAAWFTASSKACPAAPGGASEHARPSQPDPNRTASGASGSATGAGAKATWLILGGAAATAASVGAVVATVSR